MHFPRINLAQQIHTDITGGNLLSDAPNGLFLAALRRTGKSTFLQQDLKPYLENKGIAVVYVDLWTNTSKDPAELILQAIGNAIGATLGTVARLAQKAGVKEVSVAGALNVSTQGLLDIDGMTITDALIKLSDQTRKPVALIIDEAQHALTTSAGEASMLALKSARDQMQGRPGRNLMLVMSGSDRDKLLRLVNTNNAPFFGSQITNFPLLGADFVEYIATAIQASRPDVGKLRRDQLEAVFKAYGNRPQFLISAVGKVLNPASPPPSDIEGALLQEAQAQQQRDQSDMESTFLGLNAVQQVVLWRLLDRNDNFRPYDADALAFYKQKLGVDISPQQAQGAVDSMRSQDLQLIWKSQRGEYAVESIAMHTWYADLVSRGQWPPGGAIKQHKTRAKRSSGKAASKN